MPNSPLDGANSHFHTIGPLNHIFVFNDGCLLVLVALRLRDSLTFQEDVNVFCVDWAPGAADPNYVRAAVNTRLVGKQVRS